jgi:Ca-activated chloride channel family protein
MRLLPVLGAAALAAAASLSAPDAGHASGLKLEALPGQAAISVDGTRTIYLRIGLEGIGGDTGGARMPVNVALVVDRSGSMSSEDKIGKAREAAIMGLSRLGSNDVAALVAYNHEVDLLAPAAKVTSHAALSRLIDQLRADGNTALYAGTDQGIREVEKFLSRDRVNRVILISDGLANVGPSSPADLADLGRRAGSKGISVTTIGLGLGYNEDLMAKLAYNSDGNHAFAATGDDLVRIFNAEFGDVLSVAAQEIIIHIDCHPGWKPLRMLGREAEINGQTVTTRLNQLYARQQKYVILEVEVPTGAKVGEADVADVRVAYLGKGAAGQSEERSAVRVRLTADAKEAEKSVNAPVMTDVAVQVANERSEAAVELRDKGDILGARKLLEENAEYLKKEARRLGGSALDTLSGVATSAESDAAALADESRWNQTRKSMRAKQHGTKVQQSY